MTQKTTVDWLRFRTQAEVPEGLEALRGMFGDRGARLNLAHLPRGRDGWQQAAELRLGEWRMGDVCYGGESQRGVVRWNLSGEGCENVLDWDAVADLEALPKARITRLDLALTTWEGEIGHHAVEAAHGVGLFGCGGPMPNMRRILNSDPTKGETIYVGERGSDKFFRSYEKGWELLAKMGSAARAKRVTDTPEVTLIDGCPAEDIYRCELELKAKEHELPWETIERRDQYFGGAYPFLSELVPGVEADILRRRPERAPQTALKAVLANCRTQYGAAIFTALTAYHGDIGRVWEQICGEELHQGMLAAGVLEVDHE